MDAEILEAISHDLAIQAEQEMDQFSFYLILDLILQGFGAQ